MTIDYDEQGYDEFYADECPDVCPTCGDDSDEHDAAEFGGGCHVCGDCPGWSR